MPHLNNTDTDDQFNGYYCIKLDQLNQCKTCGAVLAFMGLPHDHRIVVWEEMDDPSLLGNAARVRNNGGSPRVIQYERSMGPCIEFYAAVQRGIIDKEHDDG